MYIYIHITCNTQSTKGRRHASDSLKLLPGCSGRDSSHHTQELVTCNHCSCQQSQRRAVGACLLLVAGASDAAGHHEVPLHFLGLHLTCQLKEGGRCLIHLLQPHHIQDVAQVVMSMLFRKIRNEIEDENQQVCALVMYNCQQAVCGH